MLFFRSEELIDQWCQGRGTPRRPSVRLDQLWQMAQADYAAYLKANRKQWTEVHSMSDVQPPPVKQLRPLYVPPPVTLSDLESNAQLLEVFYSLFPARPRDEKVKRVEDLVAHEVVADELFYRADMAGVDLDREMAELAKTALLGATYNQLLQKRISQYRMVIREGR